MTQSMTAFARTERQTPAHEMVWEIRSVNHRYLEQFIRMPDELRQFETTVREQIAQRLSRGKIEAILRYRAADAAGESLALNLELLDRVGKALRQVSLHIPDVKSPTSIDVLRWPGVVTSASQETDTLKQDTLNLLDEALEQLIATRQREGAKLAELIRERLVACREQVQLAIGRMPQVVAGLRSKLHERLAEVLQQVDAERVEQEIVMLAQRIDVDEELDRLTTHLDEIERVLHTKEPVGRRLDFLMQELNREANTLASKSVDKEQTAISVELKVLIEQMREQIQNIE